MINDIAEGIVNGLTNFIGEIGASILDWLSSILAILLNIIITPIDALFKSIFPDFSNALVSFNNGISLLASAPIGFIMYHIPPITRTIILLYITIMIGYYSIIWVYRAIIVIPKVLNVIKFW